MLKWLNLTGFPAVRLLGSAMFSNIFLGKTAASGFYPGYLSIVSQMTVSRRSHTPLRDTSYKYCDLSLAIDFERVSYFTDFCGACRGLIKSLLDQCCASVHGPVSVVKALQGLP